MGKGLVIAHLPCSSVILRREAPKPALSEAEGNPALTGQKRDSSRPFAPRRSAQSDILCLQGEQIQGLERARGAHRAVIHQHVYETLTLLRQVNPGIPAGLDQVVAKALAKQSAQRYGSAGELTAALQQALR